MKPNILFLVIDSFRADKLLGVKKTSITPNLDSLISNGIYFSQNICSAVVTIPSLSSIFTSLYPFESAILDGDHYKLNPHKTTYIEKLIESGYSVKATIPELESRIGLDKTFQGNIETYVSSSTLYDGLGEKICANLEFCTLQEPWFYYVHLLDLHGSATFQLSDGPKEFQDKKYGNNQYDKMMSAMDVWIGKILEKINQSNTLVVLTSDHGSEVGDYSVDLENYRQKIVGHKPSIIFKMSQKIVTYFPEFLKPLRKKISKAYTNKKNRKIDKRKNKELAKINNEYSESYKKRITQHSINPILNIFDDRVHVPLIFAGYGITSSQIISQQVRSIDIFPTIAEIINISEDGSDIRGQSLLPIINGNNFQELPVMIDSVPNSPKSLSSNVIGVRTSKYKYFRNRGNPKVHVSLFDLENDPLEESNIARNYPEVIIKMEKYLEEIDQKKIFRFQLASEQTESNEHVIIENELKQLGYL